MSGAFGDMGNLLRQAQRVQRDLERAREELKSERIEGSAGGGAVRIEVSGDGQVTRVHIAPELQRGEVTLLEDLVLAAARDALAKAAALREERLGRISGGLNLPGLT